MTRQTTTETAEKSAPASAPAKRPRLRRAVPLVLVALLASTACGGNGSSGTRNTKLVVFAASSLTGTFTTMEKAFEKAHPHVNVVTSFDSSSVLVGQIQTGATADVMATADEQSMQPLIDKGEVAGTPAVFATNHLIVVTPKDNPGNVTGLSSLAKVKFVMCDPSAPCGAAGKQVLAKAGIHARPQSLEQNVKSVLAKVTTGNADAGLVYVTDAKASQDQVRAFPIPDNLNVTTKDLIAVINASKQTKLAREWIDYVTSATGQKILQAAAFDAA